MGIQVSVLRALPEDTALSDIEGFLGQVSRA